MNKISIKIPHNFIHEIKYVINIIFGEFLGLNYEIEIFSKKNVEIILENGNKIILEDFFFNNFNDSNDYLKIENIPSEIFFLNSKYLKEENLPIIYGLPEINKIDDSGIVLIHCKVDLISSIFFMLTRWEEIVIEDRDIDERFAGRFSLSYKFDFLNRPVVDEYVEMLWNFLVDLKVKQHRIKKQNNFFVSCDVDQPFDSTVLNLPTLTKVLVADLFKRKSLKIAIQRLRRYIFNKLGNYKFDYNYTFDKYMDICENNSLKAVFYFICNNKDPKNCTYDITDKAIIDLLKKINNRGHEIGVHGSYQSFNNKEKIFNEKNSLLKVLKENGIIYEIAGNRQHYLRWDIQCTPDYLNEAGYKYDTTGGYADLPGFRFGTSNEFSMWGWKIMDVLQLKQRPLIVMECSVIDEEFLNLSLSDASKELMLNYRNKSLKYGNFSLLWHNSHFKNKEEFQLFESILSENKI